MTADTENLILEHLKRFQAQMTRFEDRLDTVSADMRAIKQHMAAFMASEASQDGELAEMKLRLDRIERRLDLRDS
jgi:regulator of replication initiation timing